MNFFPSLPSGETTESLEDERVALLTEVKKRNNEAVIKQKMHKTFSYRRKEVVQDAPAVYDFVSRWPALFTVSEVSMVHLLCYYCRYLRDFFSWSKGICFFVFVFLAHI